MVCRRTRVASSLALAALLGGACRGPLPGSDDAGSSTEAEASSEADGDGEPSDADGDGEPGDGEPGDGEPGDGEPGDGEPGDGDGDPGGCEPWQYACPDGSCAAIDDANGCCAFGGDCLPGCEPQDAVDPTPDVCDEPGGFAWNGLLCRRVCDCVGVDCGAVFDSPRACLEAHDEICGNYDFSTCPFDEAVGPTLIQGSTPEGPATYAAAAFGRSFGKGPGPGALNLRLGASELELGNYLAHVYSSAAVYEGVLAVDGAPAELGVHEVGIYLVEDGVFLATGTLTVTTLDTAAQDPADHVLEAALEVDANGWMLAGPLAIHGCERLDLVAP